MRLKRWAWSTEFRWPNDSPEGYGSCLITSESAGSRFWTEYQAGVDMEMSIRHVLAFLVSFIPGPYTANETVRKL